MSVKKIAQANGLAMVKLKLGEEALELTEAVYNNDHENIVEEIADVFIVAMQFLELTNTKDECKAVHAEKIKRTLERLKL